MNDAVAVYALAHEWRPDQVIDSDPGLAEVHNWLERHDAFLRLRFFDEVWREDD